MNSIGAASPTRMATGPGWKSRIVQSKVVHRVGEGSKKIVSSIARVLDTKLALISMPDLPYP